MTSQDIPSTTFFSPTAPGGVRGYAAAQDALSSMRSQDIPSPAFFPSRP
jgi:hypothetical protein